MGQSVRAPALEAEIPRNCLQCGQRNLIGMTEPEVATSGDVQSCVDQIIAQLIKQFMGHLQVDRHPSRSALDRAEPLQSK